MKPWNQGPQLRHVKYQAASAAFPADAMPAQVGTPRLSCETVILVHPSVLWRLCGATRYTDSHGSASFVKQHEFCEYTLSEYEGIIVSTILCSIVLAHLRHISLARGRALTLGWQPVFSYITEP